MTNEEASNILRLLATESLEGVSRFITSEKNRDLYKRAYEMAIKSLEESVAVVRCKDCRNAQYDSIFDWYYCNGNQHDKDFFCKNGNRREDAER